MKRKVNIDGLGMRKAIHRSGYSLNAFSVKLGFGETHIKQCLNIGKMPLYTYNLVMHELVDEKYGAYITKEPQGYIEGIGRTTKPNPRVVTLTEDEMVVNKDVFNKIIQEINTFALNMTNAINELNSTVRGITNE